MTWTPRGRTADWYLGEGHARGLGLSGAAFEVGARLGVPHAGILLRPSIIESGAWPGTAWRVGGLEAFNEGRAFVTCGAFTLLARHEPWEVFGPDGRRVVAIIERLGRLDASDLAMIRATLGREEPLPRAGIEVPGRSALGDGGGAVWTAAFEAAKRLDPAACVDRSWESGYQGIGWRLESPAWEDLVTIALDAARAILLDDPRRDGLEARFWALLPVAGPTRP